MSNPIRQALVKSLVQSTITCPSTGQVLDVRTCVVLQDRHGDPRLVVSQEGYQRDKETLLPALASHGWSVDPETVKPVPDAIIEGV